MRKQIPPSKRRAAMNADEAIRWFTRMLVSLGRQNGEDDEPIRTRVREAISEALKGDKAWKKKFRVSGLPMDTGPDGEGFLSNAGVYRQAFEMHGIDRTNLHQQERVSRVVMDELEATLLRDDGDFRRREPGAA